MTDISGSIAAGFTSSYGCIRVEIALSSREMNVRRWGYQYEERTRATLGEREVERLARLARAVSQAEQDLVVEDFFAIGEEVLEIELPDHKVRICNPTERIRTPKAEVLLSDCYELADTHCPRTTPRPE